MNPIENIQHRSEIMNVKCTNCTGGRYVPWYKEHTGETSICLCCNGTTEIEKDEEEVEVDEEEKDNN